MKKVLTILLVFTMVFSFAACGSKDAASEGSGDGPTYTLRLSGMSAIESHDTVALQKAAELINERTNGDVEITVYPASQLGDYTQVYEEIIRGTLDISCNTIPGTYDSRVEMCYVPYLVTNYDEYKTVYADGSFFYKTYSEILAEQDVTLLGFIPAGFIGVGATKVNEDTLFDPTATKDGLIRVPALETMKLLVEGVGYKTTTISYSDLYSALQTGIADGWYGGGAKLNYDAFRDVIKYFVDYRFLNDIYPVVMSKATLDKLPADYQKIVIDTFAEVCVGTADTIETLDAEAITQMEDYGITVVKPTDEEINTFAEYVRTNIWPQLEQFYGADIMNGLKDDVGM